MEGYDKIEYIWWPYLYTSVPYNSQSRVKEHGRVAALVLAPRHYCDSWFTYKFKEENIQV